MLEVVKSRMLYSEKNLSQYACRDEQAIRLHGNLTEDYRPNFFRDVDRIMYSLSYNRYSDKTQVFSGELNDHITKRNLHVQLVSRTARSIGRALGLNEDLIEAMALGHDIGHVPFGHLGESYLNELSLKYDNTYFMHNVESVRRLNVSENFGKGRNLTVQVLDGILCHNGEIVENIYKPVTKTKDDFIRDYEQCYVDPNHSKELKPMTLEGCVVRISDVIAYLGKDIEDAIELKRLDISQIPESIREILGSSNSSIVETIVKDIIINSIDKPYISMSKKIFDAIQDLKDFNYKYIYGPAMNAEQREDIKRMFNLLFETYLEDIRTNNQESYIYQDFINNMTDEYNQTTKDSRKVIDYIAGMTDEYMKRQDSIIRSRKKQ